MPEQKLLVTQQYARPKHAQPSRSHVDGERQKRAKGRCNPSEDCTAESAT